MSEAKTYIVDLPKLDGSWEQIGTFASRDEAIKFCKTNFGAKDGKVDLITEIDSDGGGEEESC